MALERLFHHIGHKNGDIGDGSLVSISTRIFNSGSYADGLTLTWLAQQAKHPAKLKLEKPAGALRWGRES